jgi:hypothetical protein
MDCVNVFTNVCCLLALQETMNIKDISEVIENFYYIGRVKSDKTLDRKDFEMMARYALGGIMRDYWYNPAMAEEGDRYSFVAGLLSPKVYTVAEADRFGRRRIDMSKTPVIRLPMNAHILKVLPISGDCQSEVNELTQVQPGEELFYTDSQYDFFRFFVSKGAGLDVYHLDECVKEVEIEAVFDNDDTDIPYDIAFLICNQVLWPSVKLKAVQVDNTADQIPQAQDLRERLMQKELIR